MCRKMARTGDSSSDSDSEVAGGWRRPLPSDDECDDAIVLKSHQLRSIQRDSNIVLNIRVMITVIIYFYYYCQLEGTNLNVQQLHHVDHAYIIVVVKHHCRHLSDSIFWS